MDILKEEMIRKIIVLRAGVGNRKVVGPTKKGIILIFIVFTLFFDD